LKPEWWGSPLVQEKYQEEMPVTGDMHIIIVIIICAMWKQNAAQVIPIVI